MGLLNFFKKSNPKKSPIQKFRDIITAVRSHTEFMMNDDFSGLDSKVSANKLIYQTADKLMREKLSDEDNKKVDRANEIQNVLEMLKKETKNGKITNNELEEIVNSDEFIEYTSVK